MGKFLDLFRDLKDGLGWCDNGKLQALALLLEADRAVLAPTSGFEIPTPNGRFFITDGGGSGGPVKQLFQLKVKDNTHIRVTVSVIDNHLPTGFVADDSTHYIIEVSGDGCVYAEETYNKTTGVGTSYDIQQAETFPDPDDTHARCVLGYFTTGDDGTLKANNVAFGPVNAFRCQQGFVSGTPYSVTLSAAGLQTGGHLPDPDGDATHFLNGAGHWVVP